jgi:hypothetical protein
MSLSCRDAEMVKLYEPDYHTFDGMTVIDLDEDAIAILKERLTLHNGPVWTECIYVCYGEPYRGKFFRLVDIFEGCGDGMPIVWRRKVRNKVARLLEI